MFLLTEPKVQPEPLSTGQRRNLIIVAGRKRTGKETVFKAMESILDNPQEFQFATPLKEFCISVLGLTKAQCYGADSDRETLTRYNWGDAGITSKEICKRYNKAPGQPMTAREVLQVFGTDLMRDGLYSNLWAEAGIRAAANSIATTCIFTDARFVNELSAHQFFPQDFNKTIIIRLYRSTGLEDAHVSETSLDGLDIKPNQRRLVDPENEDEEISRLRALGYQPLENYAFNWGSPKPGWNVKPCWETVDRTTPGFTYLLDNNGTVEDLEFWVRLIAKKEEL